MGVDGLKTLALDQRRSSSFGEGELWEAVDPSLWKKTRNPWLILQILAESKRKDLEKDPHFQPLLQKHLKKRKESLEAATWFASKGKKVQIAYFSMEFGLSEALPIYSGGLGLLAGDHLKACSDLGVPLIGIGLLYQQGYFRQEIDPEGKQIALYPFNEPSQLPLEKLELRIPIEFPGRTVMLRVFKAQVGHVPLYLLDTNDLLNDPADRGITSELYGGGKDTRLKQEAILGIGGVRLLRALNLKPDIYHLNEGHAAFATLERARLSGGVFHEAFEKGRGKTLFTTHTPVDAGFDRFPLKMMSFGFAEYAKALGISLEELLALGQLKKDDPFNMAYLAVRGSGHVNGVSKLHGEVSEKLFAPLKCPVGAITNGVHIPSWESPASDALWCKCSGEHRWHGTLDALEKEFNAVSDETLWEFRKASRKSLLDYTQNRLQLNTPLDPEVLTIGFSRRFATYKRVDLLLHDEARFLKLLQGKKLQCIIAGKAHPADEEGKALVQKWIAFTQKKEVQGKIFFLPDYDILLAQRLVQGIDVWINTPRRPWEASGTSGMKVLVNGGLNFSSIDGWWAEAYSPDVGWALKGVDDVADASTLYDTLEKEIIPLFYERDSQNIPKGWLKKVRASITRLTPQYSTNRMVREYTETYYLEMMHG